MTDIGSRLCTLADTQEFVNAVRHELMHGYTPAGTLGLIFGFVALIILIVVLPRLFRSGDRLTPEPRVDMLKEAANLLGLGAGERRDLALLAHRSQHDVPAAMLLTPANLAYSLMVANTGLQDARLTARIAALCEKLHGVPLPDYAFEDGSPESSAHMPDAPTRAGSDPEGAPTGFSYADECGRRPPAAGSSES